MDRAKGEALLALTNTVNETKLRIDLRKTVSEYQDKLEKAERDANKTKREISELKRKLSEAEKRATAAEISVVELRSVTLRQGDNSQKEFMKILENTRAREEELHLALRQPNEELLEARVEVQRLQHEILELKVALDRRNQLADKAKHHLQEAHGSLAEWDNERKRLIMELDSQRQRMHKVELEREEAVKSAKNLQNASQALREELSVTMRRAENAETRAIKYETDAARLQATLSRQANPFKHSAAKLDGLAAKHEKLLGVLRENAIEGERVAARLDQHKPRGKDDWLNEGLPGISNLSTPRINATSEWDEMPDPRLLRSPVYGINSSRYR